MSRIGLARIQSSSRDLPRVATDKTVAERGLLPVIVLCDYGLNGDPPIDGPREQVLENTSPNQEPVHTKPSW